MTNRPMKHVSELWSKLISGLGMGKGDLTSPDEFKKRMNTLFFNISVALDDRGRTSEDIKNRNGNEGWIANANDIEREYATAYRYWKAFSDEEQYCLLIEKRANRIALFYRFLTTIAVGLGIMLIYGLAHGLGIPMPLMRVPL